MKSTIRILCCFVSSSGVETIGNKKANEMSDFDNDCSGDDEEYAEAGTSQRTFARE